MAQKLFEELPRFDQTLIKDFQKMLDDLQPIADKLHGRKAGCACDEENFCAHHAQVYNRVLILKDDLMKAIRDVYLE